MKALSKWTGSQKLTAGVALAGVALLYADTWAGSFWAGSFSGMAAVVAVKSQMGGTTAVNQINQMTFAELWTASLIGGIAGYLAWEWIKS